MSQDKKTAVVIGASSGIGAALARQFAQDGYRLALLARRSDLLDELKTQLVKITGDQDVACVYQHDVQDFDSVEPLFGKLLEDLGSIDLVAYVSGYLPAVKPDEYNFAKDKAVFEVNILGAINWLNLTARYFQSRQSGVIVGVSSVAGDRGRRGSPAYGASKAAFNTYLESLRNRLGQYGVRVVTIKPGFVETPMLEGLKTPKVLTASPKKVAQIIARSAYKKYGEVYVPLRWKLIMTIVKAIPSFVFQKMSF